VSFSKSKKSVAKERVPCKNYANKTIATVITHKSEHVGPAQPKHEKTGIFAVFSYFHYSIIFSSTFAQKYIMSLMQTTGDRSS